MCMSFEEKALEFLQCTNYDKFKSGSYYFFSDGLRMYHWFINNKKYIFYSDDEICKKIVEQYNERKDLIKKSHGDRKKCEFTVTFEFLYMCKEFEEYNDNNKFEYSSDIKFNNGVLMGKWFKLNKQKIFEGKNLVYISIQKQYRNKLYEDKMKEKVKNSRKKQYFLVTKGYEKFSDFSDLRFFDDQKLYEWFSLNKEEIFSSDYSIDINIKNQYYQYCYFLELEEMFLKVDDEKFDEYGNRRFPSGALMYDWFVSNLNYIKNSGEEIDKEIMLQYNNYLDKNKIYKEEDKDLVKIKKS